MATTKKKNTTGKKAVSKTKAKKTAARKPVAAKKKVTAKRPVTIPSKKAVVKKKAAPKKVVRKTSVKKVAARPAVKDISYEPRVIEAKWQDQWEADTLYRAVIDERRPKHNTMTTLPYTSGDLHFGHWYPMAPSDARARLKRMNGYNVLFPIGFDAFGLPA